MRPALFTLLTFVAILLLPYKLNAQEEDFNLWAGLDLETHLNKRFDVVIGLSNRWNENVSQRDVTLAEVSLEYGKKWFSSGIGYRFENKNDLETDYMLGHRLFAFAEVETKAGKFSLKLRNKFQAQYFAVNSSEDGRIPSSHDRTRIKIDYNIRKLPLKPYLGYEIFSRVNRYESSLIDKNRIATGLSYKFSSKNKLDISFYYDHEVAVVRPDTDYILSASWTLELN
ncbi:MAG TPA: DUF2490 domain-containing protein [Bacteroidales bacterium]|nr:DUF2490 domain-containing protein [Bacteroidales bacterium]